MQTAIRDGGILAANDHNAAGSAPAAGDVVLAYDGTPESRAAMGEAIGQALRFGGSLLVVYGIEPPGPRVGEGFKEHRRVLEEQGKKLTAEAVKEARAAGVEVEALLVRRGRTEAAVAVANERGARLIVVGTRGEGFLKAAVSGSPAHKLLGLSGVPVLCVKA